ncbi:MAG: ATP-binding protein [Treponema sp.]|nr:ATP-binding protein [Treponema sp.]
MRKISSKLFLISLASIILTASIVLIPMFVSMTRIIDESARVEMQTSMNTIEAVLYLMQRRTLGASVLVAQNHDVVTALQTGDSQSLLDTVNFLFEEVIVFTDPCFVVVTDSRGVVLARKHDAKTGDNIANRRGVYRALNRLYTSDIEPRGESALGIISTTPIVAGYDVIGTVLVGYDMGRPNFVDFLRHVTNTEITVFAYDISIMTTVVSPHTGERLYGVPIAPHIAAVVLGEREIFYMETEIAPRPGELFLAFYKPFLDADGEVLGLVFSGQNLTAARNTERWAIQMSLVFSVLIIVIVFLLSRFVNDRLIVLPVKRAMHTVTQLSEGNMQTVEFANRSNDELGQLLSGTQKMARAIKAAMEREREMGVKLHEQEINERVQLVFDAAPLRIEYWDQNYNAIDCNKNTLDFYGFSSKDDYKKDFHATTPELQPDGVSSLEYWNGRLGEIFREGYGKFEFMDRNAGGDTVFMAVDGIRLKYNGNDVVLTYGKDVTMLKDALERALSASRAKSAFLSTISHEIRTPMNAIIGMAELLLRRELSGDSRGYAQDIKQAGANLLSIINDLLDFSKIEAGKMEIIPTKYLLTSFVNNVISIIRMRLVEKPIRFYTNIDSNIPNGLVGDEVRLRQILLNLLSNAVKYTDSGHIGLSITREETTVDRIWLRIVVADTGHGIKPEDREKLFGEFVQVDTKKNRATEGTGLGLAIVKSLCSAMGGSIEVESEYGEGSTFTVRLPQGIDSPEPFAAVDEPWKKKVLVYERRSIYARSVCWSLENLNVPYTLVNSENTFLEALFREEWTLVFTGYGLYNKARSTMDLPDVAFPGGRKPSVALMLEWGVEAQIPNTRFVSMPVQSVSIANVLNGRAERRNYHESTDMIRYTYPDARVLVVDDISINLMVVEGILVPYRATVDTCSSGLEAIELVKLHDYDIVFMDHMMPEMDGIRATAIIRGWEEEQEEAGIIRNAVNIVALTANAVSGMEELFIGNGFNDFLAKPIDVSKLDKILERWIPVSKRERVKDNALEDEDAPDPPPVPVPPAIPEDLLIPGIDVESGVARTGGTLAGFRRALSAFRRAAKDGLPSLLAAPDVEALPALADMAGALKSASASLGAREISERAARLEDAAGAGDAALVVETLGPFAELLAEMVENIGTALRLREMWGGTPRARKG